MKKYSDCMCTFANEIKSLNLFEYEQMLVNGAITFALILQKFRLRLSYTCAQKSGAFALSFGVTLARIFSQLFLGQLLVFEPRC